MVQGGGPALGGSLLLLATFVLADAGAGYEAALLSPLALGVVALEVFQLVSEAPGQAGAGAQVLSREGLWDLFLLIAFCTVLLLILSAWLPTGLKGLVFWAEMQGALGMLAGFLPVPALRLYSAHRRRSGPGLGASRIGAW